MDEEKSGDMVKVIDKGTGIEMVIPVEHYNPDIHDMVVDDVEESGEEMPEEA